MRRFGRIFAVILLVAFLTYGCGAQSTPTDPINWGNAQEEAIKDGGIRVAPFGFIQCCVDPKSEVADEDCQRGGFKK